MLRRLEKRILVPLPNQEARLRMLHTLLDGRTAADVRLDLVAGMTESYSGGGGQLGGWISGCAHVLLMCDPNV